jgi:hypothetical protein
MVKLPVVCDVCKSGGKGGGGTGVKAALEREKDVFSALMEGARPDPSQLAFETIP